MQQVLSVATWVTVIEQEVGLILDTIRNQPPGVSQEQFAGPREFWPGGFRIEWWIEDEEPLLTAALGLAEKYPGLLERHTIRELEKKLLDIVKEELRHFYWEPFISVAQGPVRSLLSCARPGAVEAIVANIVQWAGQTDRSIFLMPVRGLRPVSDVVTSSSLWVCAECAPVRLRSLLPLPVLPESLKMFPPWLTPSTGQRPVGVGDSLLGVVAGGWQIGVSKLRRVAGLICAAMPDGHMRSRSNPSWASVFALSERGAQVLNAFGPILPHVGNVSEFDQRELDIVQAMLGPRATPERERRFEIALEFLSTGWVLTGTQEFMNYYIALDALFGNKSGKIDSLARNQISLRAGGIDTEGKIDLVVRIRHELLHGRCSTVETSRWFLRYYRRYQRHPTADLLQIVRECLRREPASRTS